MINPPLVRVRLRELKKGDVLLRTFKGRVHYDPVPRDWRPGDWKHSDQQGSQRVTIVDRRHAKLFFAFRALVDDNDQAQARR